jgi:hypothetical protein
MASARPRKGTGSSPSEINALRYTDGGQPKRREDENAMTDMHENCVAERKPGVASWLLVRDGLIPKLSEDDDTKLWEFALNMILRRTKADASLYPGDEAILVEIGRCSHWIRPKRKVALDHAARQDRRRLLHSKVNYRDDASPQQAFRIAPIACIAQPQLALKDFPHGLPPVPQCRVDRDVQLLQCVSLIGRQVPTCCIRVFHRVAETSVRPCRTIHAFSA